MPLLVYALSFIILLLLSWFAFSLSINDYASVYQPLRSFFLPIQLAADSEFYSSPVWFLASNTLKAPSFNKVLHELGNWAVVITLTACFYKILDPKQWFILKKQPSFTVVVTKLIEQITDFYKKFFKKKKTSNFFIPRSIFALNFNQITFWSLLLAGLAVFLLPQDSSDIFGYIARGEMQAQYKMNPFHFVVSDLNNWQDNPLLLNCLWEKNPSPYGPIFMVFCSVLVKLSFGNLWLAIFLFKLLNWVVFAILLSLVCEILCDDEITEVFFKDKFSNLDEELAYKKIIYALVALNPLIITECLWNGHNDLFMGLGLLAIVYLAFKKRFNISILLIFICSLIKYTSIVLLPFVLIYAIKAKRTPFLGLASGLALVYLLIDFYQLTAVKIVKFANNISLSHKSFYDVLNSLNKYISGEDLPYQFKYLFFGIFALFLGWLAYKFFTNANEKTIFYFSFLVTFVLIMIVSPKFHSWYLITLIPLGALLHPRLIFLLSLAHLLSFTFFDQANLINYLLMTALPTGLYLKYLLHQDT